MKADNIFLLEPDPVRVDYLFMVKYYHRSDKYQQKVLEDTGFEVNVYEWGYEDFLDDDHIARGEKATGKNLRGYKRMLFEAIKRK